MGLDLGVAARSVPSATLVGCEPSGPTVLRPVEQAGANPYPDFNAFLIEGDVACTPTAVRFTSEDGSDQVERFVFEPGNPLLELQRELEAGGHNLRG